MLSYAKKQVGTLKSPLVIASVSHVPVFCHLCKHNGVSSFTDYETMKKSRWWGGSSSWKWGLLFRDYSSYAMEWVLDSWLISPNEFASRELSKYCHVTMCESSVCSKMMGTLWHPLLLWAESSQNHLQKCSICPNSGIRSPQTHLCVSGREMPVRVSLIWIPPE